MIQGTAVIPPDVGLSSLGALLAPIVIVAISAIAMGLVGLLAGLVSEWRDLAARRVTAEACTVRRPGSIRRAA